MERPEGMEPPNGMEMPEGMMPSEGMNFPDGENAPGGRHMNNRNKDENGTPQQWKCRLGITSNESLLFLSAKSSHNFM